MKKTLAILGIGLGIGAISSLAIYKELEYKQTEEDLKDLFDDMKNIKRTYEMEKGFDVKKDIANYYAIRTYLDADELMCEIRATLAKLRNKSKFSKEVKEAEEIVQYLKEESKATL